jgi:hypothetical protein
LSRLVNVSLEALIQTGEFANASILRPLTSRYRLSGGYIRTGPSGGREPRYRSHTTRGITRSVACRYERYGG